MNKNIITTMKKELRSTVRDKKSMLMMFIVPLFIPVFVFFLSYIYETIINNPEEVKYTVGVNYEPNEVELSIIEAVNLVVVPYKEEDLQSAYENDEISAYIILKDEVYSVYYNTNNSDSSQTGFSIFTYLDNYNKYLGELYLQDIKVDTERVYGNITYETVELKGKSDLVDQIILMAFIFGIMSITLASIYSAIDSTAGEKERGTLETMLTFPVKSKDLVIGKYLASLVASVITAIVCIILLLVSLGIAKNMFAIYNDIVIGFSFLNISLAFVILLGHALFISGACIAVASFSKTYKEAQGALTPLSLVTIIPMFINMLGVEVTPVLAVIPIINHALLLDEIFIGKAELLNIILMLVSTVVYIALVIKFIVKQYKSEKILFSL